MVQALRNDLDADLEREIKAELDAMNDSADRDTAQEHWRQAVRLISRRSADKVARMEAERGLR